MTALHKNVQLRLEVLRESPRIPKTLTGLAKLFNEWGFSNEPQECMWAVAYDSDVHIRNVIEVARGSHASVSLHLPTMLAAVFTTGCDRFLLVHNHPNGTLTPSQSDIDLTMGVMEAANACGLYFEDHIIVAPGGGWMSMTDKGIIKTVDYETHSLQQAAGTDDKG